LFPLFLFQDFLANRDRRVVLIEIKNFAKQQTIVLFFYGRVAERFKAAVLKTAERESVP
jgi:hypothetical protein